MSSTNPPSHNCRHCQRDVLRKRDFASPDSSDTSREITLPHTAAEIRRALEDECVFFMCFFPCSNSFNSFDLTDDLTLSQRKSDLVRTVQAYRPRKALGSTAFLGPLRVKFCHGKFSIVLQRTKKSMIMMFMYQGHSTRNGGIQLRASLGVAADELCGTIATAEDPYVGSEESLDQAQQWLSTCHASHPQCAQAADSFTPTRLLEIVQSSNGVSVRLVEPLQGAHVKWAALSYVWGGDQSFKSTSATLELLQHDTSVQCLPATIRDAIKVCEGLGLSYIWVDSLCIIQDDEQDLDRELAVMPKIYQQAWVTISASSAKSVSEGFLHNRHPESDNPNLRIPVALPYMSRDEVTSGTIILANSINTLREDLSSEPINQRAWTYQERRLSPRLLDFRRLGLSINCRAGQWSRANWLDWDHEVKRYIGEHQRFPPCLHDQPLPTWHSIVEEYASRDLTYGADKLRAIAALADLYKEEYNHTYLAGLWRESLLEDLCWYVPEGKSASSRNQLPLRPTYRAPTWSWAAVDCGRAAHKLRFHVTVPDSGQENSRVLDVAVHQVHPGTTYGQITSGYLVLRGDALETTLEGAKQRHPNHYGKNIFQDVADADWVTSPSGTPVLLFAVHTKIVEPGGHCRIFGLVLQAAATGCYRRIGAFLLNGPKGSKDAFSVINGSRPRRQIVKIV